MAEQPVPKPVPGIVAIATKYGVIGGVLSFAIFLVPALTRIRSSWVTSLIGTAILVVLIVLAHQEFKRAHSGKMTYPQGLGSGTLLSSVAALIMSVLVYLYVTYINTGYLAGQLQARRMALEHQGITGAQAQQAMTIVSSLITPVGVAVTSLIIGVIVGFIAALIVSIFTQKDPMAI